MDDFIKNTAINNRIKILNTELSLPLPIHLADRIISTELHAFVMGIINATPDSFYKESRNKSVESAVNKALEMVKGGADIIDVGGESSRPGSFYVDEKDEINRILPIIKGIRQSSDVAISVDTRKLNVMKAAFDEGAGILNDISAFEDSPDMAPWIAESEIPVILMHKRGRPDIMQLDTQYRSVFDEVQEYLENRIQFALNSGISAGKIIIDPGVGFGKNTADNLCLIKKCGMLCNGSYPVLMALSRKQCIGDITRTQLPGQRLAGSITANLIAVISGASLVRVHDVSETVEMLRAIKALFPFSCQGCL